MREAQGLAVRAAERGDDERGGGGRARERVQKRLRLGGRAAARDRRHSWEQS